MKISVRHKIIFLSVLFLIAFALIMVFVTRIIFLDELAELYLADYKERIRNIEYTYQDVDVVSGASAEISTIQSSLLMDLKKKWILKI